MIAATHLSPVMGIDVHLIQLPSPGPPVPIPHPFIGIVFDTGDYDVMSSLMAPFESIIMEVSQAIGEVKDMLPKNPLKDLMKEVNQTMKDLGISPPTGCTIEINGKKRAHAGTYGKALPPHIPLGGSFAKGRPANECEVFMGSSTVLADGSPLSYTGLMSLSCYFAGSLPTSVVLPVPTGPIVMVGGAPTVSLYHLLQKAMMKGLSKLRKSKLMQGISNKIHNAVSKIMDKLGIKSNSFRNLVHRRICSVTGHPVDIATGKVFTEAIDFSLPGPIPLEWERVWFSTSEYQGSLGHGWHHSYDMAITTDEGQNVIGVRLADGRPIAFPYLEVGESYYHRQEKLQLTRDERGFSLRDQARQSYRFQAPEPGSDQTCLLERIEDAHQNVISFHYNKEGHLQKIIDSAGRILPVRCDARGRILEIRAPHPDQPEADFVLVSYAYSEAGDLSEVQDAHQQAFQYNYQNHLLVKETNRNGLSFYFEYDQLSSQGRCLRTWGDGGIYDHKLFYDPEEKKTIVENSLGYQTTHYYNDWGLVYQEKDPLGNTSSRKYGPHTELLAEIDELGLATRYEYDERSNQTLRIHPDGATLKTEYNEQDLLISAVDEVGGTWQWHYDEKGNLLERVDSLGHRTHFQYREDGQLLSITDPQGGKTLLHYDEHKNLRKLTTPDGHSSEWKYDSLGRTRLVTDPKRNQQKLHYDLLGQIIKVEEPDGNTRLLRYDAEGNVTWVKDQQQEVHFQYGGFNTLHAREEAGTRVQFLYDTEEQLIGIRNEHGAVYSFTLDERGDVSEEKGFDGLLRQYQRDAAGRVQTVLRPGKKFTQYEYDLAGRVVAVQHSDGSEENFAYREDGALIEAINEHATVVFERDKLGRILKESQNGIEITSTYNELGNRTSLHSSLGTFVNFERDLMGNVQGIQAQRAETRWQAQFQHDAFGLEIERQLPGGLQSQWKRDQLGRPTELRVSTAGGQLQRSRQYRWETNDRLKQILDSRFGSRAFQHDALGNLSAAQYGDETWEYRLPDAVGNLFQSKNRQDRRYGAAGQLLEARGTRYFYDKEGNLIKKIGHKRQTWHYQWNEAGMLSKVIRPDRQEVSFTYDALGRRLSKRFRHQTTHWVWDGNVPLHEWVEEKALTRVYADDDQIAQKLRNLTNQNLTTWLFEAESFAPLAKIENNQTYSILTDHLGTPLSMHDEQGKEVWQLDLTIYGKVRNIETDRKACPFRYPGQYEDLETGLYYNRFRYYDPEMGSYISQDPIGLVGRNPNNYAYVYDTNVWIDVLGLNCERVIELANEVSEKYKERFMCKQFASSLKNKMKKEGIEGEHLLIQNVSAPYIISKQHGIIAETGFHEAIKVEDIVFDNMNHKGISFEDWDNDIGLQENRELGIQTMESLSW